MTEGLFYAFIAFFAYFFVADCAWKLRVQKRLNELEAKACAPDFERAVLWPEASSITTARRGRSSK